MGSAKKRKKKDEHALFSERLHIRMICLLVIFLTIISALQLGIVGINLDRLVSYLFGHFSGIVYALVIFFSTYYMIKLDFPKLKGPESIGLCMLLIACITLASLPSDHSIKGGQVLELFFSQSNIIRGGLIGTLLYSCLSTLFDYMGSIIACWLLIVVGLILMFGRYYLKHQKKIEQFKKKQVEQYQQRAIKKQNQKKIKEPIFPDKVFDDLEENLKQEPIQVSKKTIYQEQKTSSISEEIKKVPSTPIVTSEYKDYQLPPLTLLKNSSIKQDQSKAARFARENAKKLIEVLIQFGVKAVIKDVFVGPSVTKYEITLETGTRVNKILQLTDDIKMALAAKDIRIEAPIPGKSAVGVEIPNLEASMVTFKEVFNDIPADLSSNKLLVPLGKDVTGNSIYAELNKMPHLLIAGATGSGKSVCVNTIICSILMRAKPDEVKLLLVDPKKVELTNYNGIAHLLCPVVTDPKKAAVALRMIVEEMENRYELFAQYNVRNISGYNQAVTKMKQENEQCELSPLPYIVVILDEVADLMMVASKDVEDCIMRISQMARAAGIHLIVATQRPSTDVITGVIKANIPSRIAFAVSSSIDSRTILDTTGAEKLLGKGDMLYSPMGSSHPVRVQGAFVSDDEVMEIVHFVTSQMQAIYDDKYTELKVTANSNSSYEEDDEEYELARQFVIKAQKASASLLQRQFRIGYNKAARLIDQLEADGIIGPQIGSKPREVLVRGYEEE